MSRDKMRRTIQRNLLAKDRRWMEREYAAWWASLTPEHQRIHETSGLSFCPTCLSENARVAGITLTQAFESLRRSLRSATVPEIALATQADEP